MSPRGRRTVRRVIFIAVVVVAIVVVVLVALVAGNVLVLPSNNPAPVTITSVHLVIEEGNVSPGVPWFGPSSINYTSAEGYPIQVAPGGTWSVVWTFLNLDNVAHTIYKVTTSSNPFPSRGTNFTIAGTLPSLPYAVPGPADDRTLVISVTTPSAPGATYAVTFVVDAQPVA